jgi:ferredoxin
MAYRILSDCISCGICINKCPNGAVYVTEEESYDIEPRRCVECIDLPKRRCEMICPVGAIQLDPDHRETPKQLWKKVRKRGATPGSFR